MLRLFLFLALLGVALAFVIQTQDGPDTPVVDLNAGGKVMAKGIIVVPTACPPGQKPDITGTCREVFGDIF